MTPMEMAPWLDHYFPAIRRAGLGGDACWIGRMKNLNAEHNPPFYWLGRALDVIAEAGEDAAYGRRLVATHGANPCNGDGDRDDRIQGVLSEACAFAWTVAHLGPARFEAAAEGATLERGPVRLHVPAHDAYVSPGRLQPRPTIGAVVRAVAEQAAHAASTLPPARGRILYLDTWQEQRYAHNVGYHLEMTEPVLAALRHSAAEAQVGYVFTRPFQWGNPVEARY
ncbi:MAG: hypothetical protein EXR65_05195 [Dehalococcoidia bacterium]|nr:hypothetical protein [Dehalococcoidia bacterium]